jgi:hypothetical protein
MRLVEMIDLGDVLRRVSKLKTNAFAMTASREAPAFDHGHLVRDVGMCGIVRDRIDAGVPHDIAGLYSCAMAVPS